VVTLGWQVVTDGPPPIFPRGRLRRPDIRTHYFVCELKIIGLASDCAPE